MGSWGVGLYQDDAAGDLRNTISLLAKLPASGERILQILLENHGDSVNLNDDGGPTFWLVVADQFEKRGIACEQALTRALEAIDTGADLRDLTARGAEPDDLKRREKVLRELSYRLRAPRATRGRSKQQRAPSLVVQAGDVYRFPTMDYKAFNPWIPDWNRYGGFKPDGWGSLLIFAQGRVFDWFPWCAGASLTVSSAHLPSMDDVMAARFISKEQSGNYFVPRRTHMKRMGIELIGHLHLDASRAQGALPRDATPQVAVLAGWSFVPEARAWQGTPQGGVRVQDLISRESSK